ncbi:uncharacterized protein BO97DRAFT_469531 [Aspergillus homomorphus CBS 101889]|uniref:Uncharacterized protein n=1 Tax=Aspergillus homomorphus (strain CBS 101889) TaxID=1450537 RepID=A0A395I3X6_ASPHC|nr:hypothetical protein BO97DRAFT_469531 [Aspergillus homomorphus CBS 101889]RAL13888.1 hypothetical protein BO97DRAFT_469531 [Aspergillus homomorphus CBS 101889]
MGLFRRAVKLTTIGGTATLGAFFFATRNSVFVPLPLSDPIFQTAGYRSLNPHNNPTSHDLCIRRVPLSEINPSLLEKKGKLTEAFCAGVWSGWGYAYQRRYLSKKYETPETASQLWTRADLRTASYEVGTQITDHFEVVEKTPERIVVRCGDSPRKRGVRDSDGLFEMSAVVKPDEGVAELGLKSVFFKGTPGGVDGPPMPGYVLWLHQQYTKLWMETGVRNVLR